MDNAIDRKLLDLLLKGDEKALGMVVDRYYTSLCIYSAGITGNPQESEDIVQELLVNMWEKKLFRNISSLKTYLYIAVRNRSVESVKLSRSYECLESVEAEIIGEMDEDFLGEDYDGRVRDLYESFSRLSPNEYKVLMKIIVESCRYRDVADELGVSVNTVKEYMKRAMRKMRRDDLIMLLLIF